MKYTTEIFIEKAKLTHGDKYDYSKVNYTNNSTKVTIICPMHGEFLQAPANHYKSGCIKCSGRARSTTEEFITKATKVHKEIYDYNKVKYINGKTKVTITCQVHGDFEQIPNNHLQGQGCYDCGQIKSHMAQRSSLEHFITKATKLHNFKYDYSLVDYQGDRVKVTIICPTHGSFKQSAGDHLAGKGCKECAVESLGWGKDRYTNKRTILYVLDLLDGNYKIGITFSNSVSTRYSGEPTYPIEFEQVFEEGSLAWEIENSVLRQLRGYKYKGSTKYFKKTKNTEVLTINPIETIKEFLMNNKIQHKEDQQCL